MDEQEMKSTIAEYLKVSAQVLTVLMEHEDMFEEVKTITPSQTFELMIELAKLVQNEYWQQKNFAQI